MINCELYPLPEPDQIAVRDWLGRGAAQLVVRIVEGKAKKLLSDAVTTGINDTEKFPNCEIVSTESMKEARRYRVFLEVLQEITTQAEPYTIAKLS